MCVDAMTAWIIKLMEVCADTDCEINVIQSYVLVKRHFQSNTCVAWSLQYFWSRWMDLVCKENVYLPLLREFSFGM